MKGKSKRCGKGNCEFYDCNNKISGCKKFDDRNKCLISNKQRKNARRKGQMRDHVVDQFR